MQKVITITSYAIINSDAKFIETQYPELNKLLQDGYKINQVIPIIKPANTNNYYETIFILELY
jgi:hypothetical protein